MFKNIFLFLVIAILASKVTSQESIPKPRKYVVDVFVFENESSRELDQIHQHKIKEPLIFSDILEDKDFDDDNGYQLLPTVSAEEKERIIKTNNRPVLVNVRSGEFRNKTSLIKEINPMVQMTWEQKISNKKHHIKLDLKENLDEDIDLKTDKLNKNTLIYLSVHEDKFDYIDIQVMHKYQIQDKKTYRSTFYSSRPIKTQEIVYRNRSVSKKIYKRIKQNNIYYFDIRDIGIIVHIKKELIKT